MKDYYGTVILGKCHAHQWTTSAKLLKVWLALIRFWKIQPRLVKFPGLIMILLVNNDKGFGPWSLFVAKMALLVKTFSYHQLICTNIWIVIVEEEFSMFW